MPPEGICDSPNDDTTEYPVAVRGAVRDPKWHAKRNHHLARFPACAACGDIKNHPKQVHHKVPVHVDPSKELDEDNFITLCEGACHLIMGHLWDYHLTNTHVVEDCERMLAARLLAKSMRSDAPDTYVEGTDIG